MFGQILAASAVQGGLHAAANAGDVVGADIDGLLAEILAAAAPFE